MSRFISMNFTMVTCQECGEQTTIEPGRIFSELNCKCKTEVASQFNDIKTFRKVTDDGTIIELLGEFKNGDLEIKYVDGSLSYRISKQAFKEQFEEVIEGQEDEADKTKTDEGTLSLEMLIGLTPKQVKEEYSVNELKALAKALDIKGYSRMKEDTLIERLLGHEQDTETDSKTQES